MWKPRATALGDRVEKLTAQLEASEERAQTAAASEDELVALRSQQVSMRAEAERADQRFSAVEARAADAEAQLEKARAEASSAEAARAATAEGMSEKERELEVALEERDAARRREEELHHEWIVCSDELLDLQAGYVGMSDRLNEKNDELMELQEKLDQWQELAEARQGIAAAAAPDPREERLYDAVRRTFADVFGGVAAEQARASLQGSDALETALAFAERLAGWFRARAARGLESAGEADPSGAPAGAATAGSASAPASPKSPEAEAAVVAGAASHAPQPEVAQSPKAAGSAAAAVRLARERSPPADESDEEVYSEDSDYGDED